MIRRGIKYKPFIFLYFSQPQKQNLGPFDTPT